jgi:hypothetical protein
MLADILICRTDNIIGMGVGAGEDMTVGDGGDMGAEDSVDDNADDADEDAALICEQVARAGPITCCTNTSDMSWKACKQKCKHDVIKQDSELCDDTQLGCRSTHYIMSIYLCDKLFS